MPTNHVKIVVIPESSTTLRIMNIFRLLVMTLLSALVGAFPAAFADNIKLPDLGDHSAKVVTPLQEKQMGENFYRRARRSLRFVKDPEINDYIQRLGERLVSHSDQADKKFTFFVIDSVDVNAFAVPGGFIGVNTGLIMITRTEGELASVLAHETAHVTQRHIPRLLAAQQRSSAPTMAAILAAILLGGSSKNTGAIIAATTAGATQKLLNFTRSFEQEADRHGISLLAKSGYDARDMPRFFERLQHASRFSSSGVPEFLRTHPVTSNRIAETRDRAQQYPKPSFKLPDSDYLHIRAKIRALKNGRNYQRTARQFAHRLKSRKFSSNGAKQAERYGYALALAKNKQYTQARNIINGLLKQRPGYTYYLIAQAEIELMAGRHQRALRYYRQAVKHHPGHYPIQHNYAATLLKARQHQAAKTTLEQILKHHSNKPILHKMLATAAGNSGDRVQAHRSLAEYYYMSGYPKTAIKQLRISARYAKNNFYTLSSIEARISEIKAEIELYKKG